MALHFQVWRSLLRARHAGRCAMNFAFRSMFACGLHGSGSRPPLFPETVNSSRDLIPPFRHEHIMEVGLRTCSFRTISRVYFVGDFMGTARIFSSFLDHDYAGNSHRIFRGFWRPCFPSKLLRRRTSRISSGNGSPYAVLLASANPMEIFQKKHSYPA
jgi:hypothetical protein